MFYNYNKYKILAEKGSEWIKNKWTGKGYVENIKSIILKFVQFILL